MWHVVPGNHLSGGMLAVECLGTDSKQATEPPAEQPNEVCDARYLQQEAGVAYVATAAVMLASEAGCKE